MYLYKELQIVSPTYAATPVMTTHATGYSGPLNAVVDWQPEWHMYRVIGAGSGGDIVVSWDGVNDALRIPFVPTELAGAVLPISVPVTYRAIWARTSGTGCTGSLGLGMYMKQ